MKVKKGDKVIVQAGKDKGKVSVVDRVIPKADKIVLDGLNIVKKHAKPTEKNKRGGLVEISMPLQSSNVMVVCPGCGKPTRVGYQKTGSAKERICKKCKASLDRSLDKIGMKEKK